MHISFLPRSEVEQVLLEEQYAEEATGEMLAEYGSSAFYSGFSAGDAMVIAQNRMAELREDFDRSEDAPKYYARLDAARLFDSVRSLELGDYQIPEFYPGARLREDIFSDDIPF